MAITRDNAIHEGSERRERPPTDDPSDDRPRKRARLKCVSNCQMTAHRFATQYIDTLQRGAAVFARQPERPEIELLPWTNRNRRSRAR